MTKPDEHSQGGDLDFITEEGLYEHDPNAAPIVCLQASGSDEIHINIKDDKNLITIKLPTENETLQDGAYSLLPMGKIINRGNVITPKFVRPKHCYKAKHPKLNSISEQVCKITAKFNSSSNSKIYVSIGSAVIMLNNMNGYFMAFTCAHVLYPTELNDLDLSLIEMIAEIDGKKGVCSVVKEGSFQITKQVSDDWVLLKIVGEDLEPLQNLPIIPSPSMVGLLDHVTDSNTYPEFYTTLLFGYYNVVEDIKVRFQKLGISDIWKLIPQEQLSASLGWTMETSNNNIIHNCGRVQSCCGGPIFKCRIKVDEMLECNDKELSSLMDKSYFSLNLLGIHCAGALYGNIMCSSHNFFKSYYDNVYTPHKYCFSKENQLTIEMEWKFMNH